MLLEACGASHADLRQCAAYGVGVVVARAPEVLRPHAGAALARLLAIVQHPVGVWDRGFGFGREGRTGERLTGRGSLSPLLLLVPFSSLYSGVVCCVVAF